ncbi:asparagine synthetase domain-containing protein 1 isoform X1 [Lingula anatina]|uniref:Asparagine synthetase domain-containing protein 1 isoform X1 n=1 Tax=Lingula anatina TaxID=7574 RepID=A0A1S3INX1_LINAN|nr:asparagine synthetase domain-containing protein 1 isoform X1 [Lingula anatina]|eukprot:XP_013399902.1 asparagine synthetase domain-containing protein 1 isoform X1 [Lingula anatina]
MCGICAFLWVGNRRNQTQASDYVQKSRLHHRGPDSVESHEVELTGNIRLSLHGCVLHLRGQLTPQPVQDSDGNLLLWNGEVFGGLEIRGEENDSQVVLQHLGQCTSDEEILQVFSQIKGPWAFIYFQKQRNTLWFGRDCFGRRSLLWHLLDPDDFHDCFGLASVQIKPLKWEEVPANGIYKMILPDGHDSRSSDTSWMANIIWLPWITGPVEVNNSNFPVDPEEPFNGSTNSIKDGQVNPSKNIHFVKKGGLCIQSTIDSFNRQLPTVEDSLAFFGLGVDKSKEKVWDEASSVSAKASQRSKNVSVEMTYASLGGDKQLDPCKEKSTESGSNNQKKNTPQENILSLADSDMKQLADKFTEVLSEAVKRRVQNQPTLCHFCLRSRQKIKKNKASKQHCSTGETFLLGNYVGTPKDPKDLTSKVTQLQVEDDGLVTTHFQGETNTNINLASSDFQTASPLEDIPVEKKEMTSSNSSGSDINVYSDGHFTTDPGSGVDSETRCQHARIAVLFSGGIDSIVIAALADRHVPDGEPIDLLNVAFEQQQNTNAKKKEPKNLQPKQPKDSFEVPDRITGKEGLKELNPHRPWNFIEVNVTLEELQRARNEHVSELVYPSQTVLDDSIGCAIWFAARGRGILRITDTEMVNYTSTARVVLVGMGADEQLAGYSRHRVKFNTNGWQGLVDEIDMEIKRISSRNLGRDDRIITDHARESRLPFLDEDVVFFLNSLPMWKKCLLSLPRGVGEKFLLRVAAAKLGLTNAASLPKRAIQFGSRIAKLESRNEKASDTCERLS